MGRCTYVITISNVTRKRQNYIFPSDAFHDVLASNSISAGPGLRPRPRRGELTTLPRLPTRLGSGLHCVSKKLILFIVVVSLSDFIRSCKFLAETYSRKFGTNTNAQATTSRSFHTSPCKVLVTILRHTVGLQRQIRSLHIEGKLSYQITTK